MKSRYVSWILGQKKDRVHLQSKNLEVMHKKSVETQSVYWRHVFVIFCFLGCYLSIAAKLVYYSQQESETKETNRVAAIDRVARPDILDRNGQLLATDMKTYSLFAEPRRIIDPHETIELLSRVLPDLDWDVTYQKLQRKNGFAWIQRGLTPGQKASIMALGLPGIGFRIETRRFYPGGRLASHILGFVDVDNRGISGIEKYIDQVGLNDLRAAGLAAPSSLEAVKLSLDIRVQAAVHDVLTEAIKRYRALAAAAIVLNSKTGEILALVSLPDFNANHPVDAHKSDRFNRVTAGIFEMGSVIKSFTTAMALDSGQFQINSMIDASKPVRFGRHLIHDFHGKYRPLALWEVFIYSSNIGSVKEANTIGIGAHRAFLKRLGLLDCIKIELPEIACPIAPQEWKAVHSATISFGHGMMTTPLQTATGAAALVNGGFLVEPTLLYHEKGQTIPRVTKVIKEKTSLEMRYLYQLNAAMASGRNAVVPGYRVGGKTGTGEKVENGKYLKNKLFNSFLAAFPIEDPAYIVLTVIDDPQVEEGASSPSKTSASNAAPITAAIIRRSANFLGILPDFQKEKVPILSSERVDVKLQ